MSSAPTQEDILSQTSAVAQGLESLRVEHQQILNSLTDSLTAINKEDGSVSRLIEDKLHIIWKTIEKLELGIGEAEASFVDDNHAPSKISSKW